jgi:PAS domain S-box-containing protein
MTTNPWLPSRRDFQGENVLRKPTKPMESATQHIVTRLLERVKGRRAKAPLHRASDLNQLTIGTRLTLCFVIIALLMLVGDAVALWQFHLVRGQASRLNQVDQRSVAVLRVHADLLVLRDKLEDLAATQNAHRFEAEAAAVRKVFLEEVDRAEQALRILSSDVQRDPTILSTLETIASTMAAQIDAMTDLASAGDWSAVLLRLENQVRALSSLTSSVVERVDREVTQERAQAFESIRRVQQRVFLILLLAACVTLFMATMLGLIVTRSITRPLARLDAGAQALACGDFHQQVTVAGKDELAILAGVFNNAARQLRDLYEALRTSEARFRSLIENSSDLIMILDREGTVGYVSPSSERLLGSRPEELLGKSIFGFIHSADLSTVRNTLAAQIPGVVHPVEFRLRHTDGQPRILEAIVSNLLDEPSVSGVVVNARDVTDRKRSEEALRQLSMRMLRIQEEEQRRIAREVHDSTSQEITALTLNLGALRRSQESFSPGARKKIADCLAIAKRTSRQIRTFSYLLHPPMLEEFGLWAALRIFIEEFRSRSGLHVSLKITPLLEELRLDPSCEMVVFRVIQEALANVHRHSKSKTASIEITMQDSDFIKASISDSGHGIPSHILTEMIASTGRFAGVGIPGMQERVSHIEGRLEIHSDSQGTTITAIVPAEYVSPPLEGSSVASPSSQPKLRAVSNVRRHPPGLT